MPKFNDIDMKNWKDYESINTDSLWLFDKRDSSGVHSADYHGNFIPQIVNQLLSRYTCRYDWILDPFVGNGTSLIEAQRLERNGIGIDIQDQCVSITNSKVELEKKENIFVRAYKGDSKEINLKRILDENNKEKVQFIIYHPPYWDIIKFSDHKEDLSNTKSLDEFISYFSRVIDNTIDYLEKGRYCACVIGDKYSDGQIYPLGYRCMDIFSRKGLVLKGIVIKNINETKGKSGKSGIWRYRALNSDFFIFKHEYIFVFKK